MGDVLDIDAYFNLHKSTQAHVFCVIHVAFIVEEGLPVTVVSGAASAVMLSDYVLFRRLLHDVALVCRRYYTRLRQLLGP